MSGLGLFPALISSVDRRIRPGHPLAKGLKYALFADQSRCAVSGLPVQYSGTPLVTQMHPKGRSVEGVSGATNPVAYLAIPSFTASEVTLVFVGGINYNYPSGTNVLCGFANTAGNQFMGLQAAGAVGNTAWTVRQTNGGGTTLRNPGVNASTISTDDPCITVARYSGSSSIDVFWNGVLDNGTLTTGSSGSNSWNTFALGGIVRSSVLAMQNGNNARAVLGYEGLLSDAAVMDMQMRFAQMWRPAARLWWMDFGASAGGVSGSIAATNAGDTAAASGTPVIVGTIARTNGNDTSSAAGSPIVAGTIARTNGNDTASATGTTVNQGSIAATNAPDMCAASGLIGNNISGTIAATNAGDTAAASGTTTVVGTVARTNASDTANLSGTPVLVGTVAATNRPDTAALTGVAGSVTGTIGAAERPDGCSAAGISGTVVPRLGGFEVVGRHVREVSAKTVLQRILERRAADREPVQLPNKVKRRKAKLLETIAAKAAIADEPNAEERFQALLAQWVELGPAVAGSQLRADDALRVFTEQVAAQAQRLQREAEDDETISLLLMTL